MNRPPLTVRSLLPAASLLVALSAIHVRAHADAGPDGPGDAAGELEGGPSNDAPTTVCVPGAQESCACAGGQLGRQTCSDAGTSFGPCEECAPPGVCIPGMQVQCFCVDGGVGVQTCDDAGAALGSCTGCSSVSTTCVPGTQLECGCPGGNRGLQTCSDAGNSYGPCSECPALSDAGDAASGAAEAAAADFSSCSLGAARANGTVAPILTFAILLVVRRRRSSVERPVS
jgi:hypothetical protein